MASSPRSSARNKVNNDPGDELKRRARRRLVGAIALFLAAVIVVPALVETEAPQTPSKIQLVVPERPSVDIPAVKESAKPQPEAKPEPKSDAKPVAAPADPEPVVLPPIAPPEVPKASIAKEPTPAAKPANKQDIKPDTKPDTKPAPKAEAKAEPKPEPKPVPKAEVAKPAQEKTGADPIADFAKAAPSDAGKNDQFWVQVAAVGDQTRAETLKKELATKGFTARIESASGPNGTVYRVRVGPFKGQEKANASKEQLSSAGYSGRVVQ